MAIYKIYEEFINNELKIKFQDLKEKWWDETAIFSDPDTIYGNENYQKIIALGKDIIPILIEDFDFPHSNWFHALKEITNEDPIQEQNRGYVSKMKEDWKKWHGQYS